MKTRSVLLCKLYVRNTCRVHYMYIYFFFWVSLKNTFLSIHMQDYLVQPMIIFSNVVLWFFFFFFNPQHCGFR